MFVRVSLNKIARILSINSIWLGLIKMPPADFKCKQCGNCCLNLGDAFETCATEEDIHLWNEEKRDDIFGWVDPISVGGGQFVYDIWISPVTGDDV